METGNGASSYVSREGNLRKCAGHSEEGKAAKVKLANGMSEWEAMMESGRESEQAKQAGCYHGHPIKWQRRWGETPER